MIEMELACNYLTPFFLGTWAILFITHFCWPHDVSEEVSITVVIETFYILCIRANGVHLQRVFEQNGRRYCFITLNPSLATALLAVAHPP